MREEVVSIISTVAILFTCLLAGFCGGRMSRTKPRRINKTMHRDTLEQHLRLIEVRQAALYLQLKNVGMKVDTIALQLGYPWPELDLHRQGEQE